MISTAASPPAPAPSPAGPTALRAMAVAWLVIAGFWWSATGVLMALQRSDATRLLGLVAANAAVAAGIAMIVRARPGRTPRDARLAVFGAAFVWAWVSATLYGGWLVGPSVPPPAASAGWLEVAMGAALATAWHEAAALAGLAAVFLAVRGGAHRTALWAYTLLWGAHELARINLFVGVANPALNLLPRRLEHLVVYFGPTRNTPLVPLSFLVFAALAAVLVVRVRSAATPFDRNALALLSAVAGLAALEFVLLGTTWQPPVWDPFLALRGG